MNNKFFFKMRGLLLLGMLIPFLGISQTKNVVTTQRVFPKIDKVLEFEKALAAHAQKYHTGDTKWRVFEIQSGPDFGGYHITEGPSSWMHSIQEETWERSITMIGIKAWPSI